MTTLAERLNKAMEQRGVTARELSKRTGITESDISHYRKGDYQPKRERVYFLSRALNVSPGWLMGLDLPQNQLLLDNEILDMWHSLSANQQDEIYHHIRTLIEDHKEEPLT